MTRMGDSRLPATYMSPGTSSFADFLGHHQPDLLPGRRAVPAGNAGELAPDEASEARRRAARARFAAGDHGRHTMAQEQKQPKRSTEDEAQVEELPEGEVAERKEQLDEDIDAILDEIDDVLESNAEDFVKSFIQKGGE